jgi:hypothetical protein
MNILNYQLFCHPIRPAIICCQGDIFRQRTVDKIRDKKEDCPQSTLIEEPDCLWIEDFFDIVGISVLSSSLTLYLNREVSALILTQERTFLDLVFPWLSCA